MISIFIFKKCIRHECVAAVTGDVRIHTFSRFCVTYQRQQISFYVDCVVPEFILVKAPL